MRDVLRSKWALLALLPLPGCCAISQSMTALFCGPRQDAWLVQSFDSSRNALKTFLAAVSRDDRRAIYRCLSFELKRREGFGEAEFEVFWQRRMADTPGLNIADQAVITGPFPLEEDKAAQCYRLTLETVPRAELDVRVRRQDFWSVQYLQAGTDERQETGEVVPDLRQHLSTLLDHTGLRTPVQAMAPGPFVPDLEVDEIVDFRVGREWKIDGFQQVK